MAKGARLAVRCTDLTPHTWDMDDESVNIGGFVRSMAWDPLGERLAIIFKGTVHGMLIPAHLLLYMVYRC